MDGSASFGYWVRRRRKALDLTQDELAARCKLFARLGVFVGGCTIAAAEAITTLNISTFERFHVLDRLAALVDKSLVRQEDQPDGEPRFVMLETIREYAQGRLEQNGEAAALNQAHLAYYLARAEQAIAEALRTYNSQS